MKLWKLTALILSVLILLSLTGCGVATDSMTGNEMGAVNDSYTIADGVVKEEVSVDGESTSNLPQNRKLIQTVTMHVETENLDTVLQQINSRITELNGYTESSNIQNGSAYSGKRYRSAYITVRIPADTLDSFINKVAEISNIVSSRKTVDDITLKYVATESRMKALQTEEARLLELLAQAETMNDLLTVESRLTDVRTELEQVTSALRVFDNQVDYATVYLDINEVKEYTEVTEPETLWQRIGSGFLKSLKGLGTFFRELFVFVIVASPYLVLIAAVVFGILFISRGRKRKERQKKERKSTDGAAG